MRKTFLIAALTALTISTSACTRIGTGEVGVRRTFFQTIDKEELQPGTINQTIVGDVMHFHTKDVPVDVSNLTPLAGDDSILKDMDVRAIYSVNPTGAAELYMSKSSSFHTVNDRGETLLMYNYISTLVKNATYKAVRAYPTLKLSDNRANLEREIQHEVNEQLRVEKLDTELSVSQIIILGIVPADNVVASANARVQAQNDTLRKTQEVETAKKEAERIAALNANSGATGYMAAQALLNISEAVQAGKVNTIVIPYDFKGIVNVK